ncbi:conserved hypothetical protein [Desulfamplus magnetovallimortis]|uniref:DUF7379 domain-containing protein n=1 Tax=Desulfamplus magnetovallimortis TaxID=1246637 RepID=A0A1W1HB03_9BACT|nr:hypothetical protein [Desulfamplus magnetovallimortis]SLM29660.1 conserved hypothetical protein [Desulfamplus magnetovallimortis]
MFYKKNNFSSDREAVLSALNGVLGDYLESRNNPLSISMEFRRNGKSLSWDEISEMISQTSDKLIIMLHGSCMNDLQWNRKGHDHGAALSFDLEMTTIYLHYNTGLHISENGRKFADLMESLNAHLARPAELYIVAHSMGGLVSRSACHYGKLSCHTWLESLKKIVFMGTPHHGAPLAKGGIWIDTILEANPYSAPFARLGKIRSSGLTDLCYGNVLDEDWKGKDRFKMSGDIRTPVPLPEGLLCYAIAGATSREPCKLGDDLIGDGLVTVNSALGRHKNPQFQLCFPDSRQFACRGMTHFDLLNHSEVYKTLKEWLVLRE